MRFIIQDYLEHLKEREELDAILPDLLRAMGFQIVKLAFRGEVEHGVDIAALDDTDEGVLYLIQVKSGDINQRMWDAGPNSIRATLNNLLDVPFEDLTQPRLQQAKKQVILAHNGILRENVRERFNGYVENTFLPRMPFERWNLDKLAKLFEEHLLNERILPKRYQILLKRTLVFLDVPDYDLDDFKKLLTAILPDVKRLQKKRRQKIFGFIRLVLAIIHKQCQEMNNLSPALIAYEHALLSIWGWMFAHNFFNKPFQKEFVQKTYPHYLHLLIEWTEKIAPALTIQHGLSFGGPFERVEYPMRTFQTIGNLGLLSIALGGIPDPVVAKQILPRVMDFLIATIQNNPSRHRPLCDNHSIDIFLGLWPLLLITNQENFAKWWLEDILKHLAIRKRVFERLPELYNNMDAIIEYEATGERPLGYVDSSSTLIYMLFEFCLLLDAEDLYLEYRPIFEDVNLQMWYPPEDVENSLYFDEIRGGDTETSIRLPEEFNEFRSDVEARHSFDKVNYSPIKYGIPTLLLLASKYFRTPIFPLWWRYAMFPDSKS